MRIRESPTPREGAPRSIAGAGLVLAALVAAAPATAEEDRFILRLEAIVMDAYGHDQHVLTVHRTDLDAAQPLDAGTAVDLDTDRGPAYRGTFEHRSERWGWGIDFLWFNTSQAAPDHGAAADGAQGPIDRVVFEVADRSFTSSGPGETLFYRVLEDTDLALWTADLYATRLIAVSDDASLRLLFGLRNADFDNDYRAVVGLEAAGGTRLDASSNYERMMGPLVGVAGAGRAGRSTVEGRLSQSVVLGDAELTTSTRDFSGALVETPAFTAEESFGDLQEVAIPITELHVRWTYDVTRRFALGLAAESSAWWDVQVPPGVVPGPEGNRTLHENTIVLFGLSGIAKLSF